MKTKSILALTLTGALALAGAGSLLWAEEPDAAAKERISKAEQGATTIDVSGYPKAMQERYVVFAEKCASCHKLSRGINTDFVLPDEWERYTKRMLRKPGSGMDSASTKKVYEFLVYDSAVRKKDALEAKLKTLSPEEQKAARDKIKEIMDKYK